MLVKPKLRLAKDSTFLRHSVFRPKQNAYCIYSLESPTSAATASQSTK